MIPEHGGIGSVVRLMHGDCLASPDPVFDAYPHLDERELASIIVCAGRAPWPSIRGNPPKYRERPFYDARLWEGD